MTTTAISPAMPSSPSRSVDDDPDVEAYLLKAKDAALKSLRRQKLIKERKSQRRMRREEAVRPRSRGGENRGEGGREEGGGAVEPPEAQPEHPVPDLRRFHGRSAPQGSGEHRHLFSISGNLLRGTRIGASNDARRRRRSRPETPHTTRTAIEYDRVLSVCDVSAG